MTLSPHDPPTDVRMRGFARRATVEQALAQLDAMVNISKRASEQVPLLAAAGRVLADDIASRVDVPLFDRAMMDGFAVRADDAQGASPYNRLALTIIGEALPGRPFDGVVAVGQAVRVMTGAPLPRGTDAVVPVETTEVAGEQVFLVGDVAPEKHIGRRGEDVRAGNVVLSRGRLLRPQDVGVLSSIGVGEVPVVRRPKVRVVITGDEILPPGEIATGFRIVDANGPMLAALVARDGGELIAYNHVRDDPIAILAAMRGDADVVLISGGSSVGREDHAPMLLAQHGELTVHGIAMRPSSPAGFGRIGERLVFLLPGNPVSCLCAYDFFAGRALRAISGRNRDWPYRRAKAPLSRKLTSVVGRTDYARVQVTPDGASPLAIGGASILTGTTRADGFVIVAADSEGFPPGAEVEVFFYD